MQYNTFHGWISKEFISCCSTHCSFPGALQLTSGVSKPNDEFGGSADISGKITTTYVTYDV